MENLQNVRIADTTANPAPLGLMAFGLTTLLLNIHNAGFFPMDTMIMAMGIFYGGLAQVIVGIMEWKKNNTFGTTAFTSYGFFWIALVALMILPKLGVGTAPSALSMGYFLSAWGLFSFCLWIATFRTNKALTVTFTLLILLFGLLTIRDFSGSESVGISAGWVGIFCALSAMYTAFAQILNEMWGKTVLPIGPWKK